MNKVKTLSIAALLAVSTAAGCSSAPSAPANSANQTTNKTSPTPVANATQAKTPETPANDSNAASNSSTSAAPSTPTAAYKAAYAARKNKDIAGLKKLLSKDMFEFFEMMGEGKPNALDEGLKQLTETPQGASDEVRNEKITGDTATLQYLDPKGEWVTMDFVKEDGAWKLTIARMPKSDGKSAK